MNKHLFRFLLLSAALIPSASVLAADLDVPPPPPVEELRSSTYDWTGVSIGLFASANAVDGHYSFKEKCYDGVTTSPTYGETDDCNEVDPEMSGIGYGAGIKAGVDYQVGDIVFGVMGDWQFGGRLADNDDPNDATYLNMKNLATVKGRLGWALNDTLLYATGGLAGAEMEFGGFIPDKATGVEDSDAQWAWGYTIGGGIEHAVTDNISVGLEYNFVKLNGTSHYLSNGIDEPTPDGVVTPLGEGDVDMEYNAIHSIRASVNYRFSL